MATKKGAARTLVSEYLRLNEQSATLGDLRSKNIQEIEARLLPLASAKGDLDRKKEVCVSLSPSRVALVEFDGPFFHKVRQIDVVE